MRERVLVIGDDMRSTLAVVRSLGRAGKAVHLAPFNWHSPATRSRYVAHVHKLPRNTYPAEWAKAVAGVLERWHFDLIIPCCDRGMLLIDSAADVFAGQKVARPSPPAAAATLFDKAATREHAQKVGVALAPGRRLQPDDTAADLVERLGLPLYLKPRKSYELGSLEKRGNVLHIVDAPSLAEALSAIPDPDQWVVEAEVPGIGVGYSVLAHAGTVSHAFQHRRLREADAGGSSLRVSEALDPELSAAVAAIVALVHFSGVCMFEFRRMPNGRHILLEANPRFWGSVPLPVALGVDFPLFLYDQEVHGISHPPVAYPAGVRARNLLQDARNVGMKALKGRGVLGTLGDAAVLMAHPLLAALGLERSDTLVRDDLAPGLLEIGGSGKMALDRWRASRPGFTDRRVSQKAKL